MGGLKYGDERVTLGTTTGLKLAPLTPAVTLKEKHRVFESLCVSGDSTLKATLTKPWPPDTGVEAVGFCSHSPEEEVEVQERWDPG